jgi:hypothetical protein
MLPISTWQMFWPKLRDALFRFGLYRGIAVPSVPHLIVCLLSHENQFSRVFHTYLNLDHPLASWLMDDCSGPWMIRMVRPYHLRKTYLAFARVSDAVTFRLLSSG